jgi:hypothetical protein
MPLLASNMRVVNLSPLLVAIIQDVRQVERDHAGLARSVLSFSLSQP